MNRMKIDYIVKEFTLGVYMISAVAANSKVIDCYNTSREKDADSITRQFAIKYNCNKIFTR